MLYYVGCILKIMGKLECILGIIGRRTGKKIRMRKRKRKMILIVALELLFIVGAFGYLMGRGGSASHKNDRNNIARVEAHLLEEKPGENSTEDISAEDISTEDIGAGNVSAGDSLAEKKEENNMEDSESTEALSEDNAPDKSKEDIILVNKDNRVPEDYSVTLKTLPDGVNKAAEEAHGPLCDMLKAGQKEGLAFEICSSYRSVERQQELLDEDINELIRQGYTYREAYLEVTKETMPPGHSEHATGLAFDIVSLWYQMLDEGQEQTAENIWLREHCAEYGFILRYPEGKEDITRISYESWHFRYVGVEVAEYIMEKGITLEEYLEDA